MTTVEFEAKHPRGDAGKFAQKVGSGADLTLPETPEAFEDAHTFADIDRIWKTRRAEADGFIEEWKVRQEAIEQGQKLREAGQAPQVPTALETEGWGANPYSDCQNDAELNERFELCTEEPPGDGEASKAATDRWYQKHYNDHDARRAELLAAGVVEGEDTLG